MIYSLFCISLFVSFYDRGIRGATVIFYFLGLFKIIFSLVLAYFDMAYFDLYFPQYRLDLDIQRD